MSALVVTAGALTWELGLEFAIVAVARARATGVDLCYDIVGDGPERERVLYTAFDLGLEDVVHVFRPDRRAVVRLADADVFLWPDLVGRSSHAGRELVSLGVESVSTVNGPRVHLVPTRDPVQMASSLALVTAAPRTGPKPQLGPRSVAAILEELGCV